MPEMPLVRPPPSSRDLVFDDGEPLESARHRDQMVLLIDSLKLAWSDRDDFYVGGNEFLYFSETQSRRNDFRGPDVFVVLGVAQRERKGWVVWEEDGKAPNVVIELLSETTERVDRNDKMRLYARTLRVGEYFLFDPWTSVFEGYTLDPARISYTRKVADPEGHLLCEQLGLWLGVVPGVVGGVEAPWLRWLDANKQVLRLGSEQAIAAMQQAKAAMALADAEAERARAEAERARVEAERARVEAERARVEAERARAEGERARAEGERADRLEEEVRALRALLKRERNP